MNLNKLKEKVYKNAVAHGWHDEEYSDSHWLCLVIAELMEAIEADRNGEYAQVGKFKEWQGNSIPFSEETRIRRFNEDFEAYLKDTVEDELADACIRLLDYFGTKDITIDDSCADDEVLEDFSHIYDGKTFTESVFDIVTSITRYEIQIAFLKIFGLSKHRGIDIEWHILQKMKYNKFRPFKHGNKKY